MKKIMFNDRYGLTEAVLDGRKTQTRRLVPRKFFSLQWDERDDTLVFENEMGDFIDIRQSGFVRYKVGEIVAVAQSYEQVYREEGLETMDMLVSSLKHAKGWTNKMFVRADLMPLKIRFIDIHIERLQDISDYDALNEGVFEKDILDRFLPIYSYHNAEKWFESARDAFASLIDKISGRGTWERNPYVVVYGFELVK